MPFERGQTAIVVAVPEAEPVVDRWRQRYDSSAALGVPAHVTILYPFLHAELVDDAVLARLRRLFAAAPAFELELRRCGRFPDALYLEPEPADIFRDLTVSVFAQWPETPPYCGMFDTVIPHLTVAQGVDEETFTVISRDVSRGLPVLARVTEAVLLVCDGGRWERHTGLPFG